jgi:hypothetical protein
MSDEPVVLQIRAYSGRENGLMIVGDRAALASLGRQLVEAVPIRTSANLVGGWPPEVAAPTAVGPYRDLHAFRLSFHLTGTAPLDSLLPLRRRTLRAPLWIIIGICAVTGVVTIVRWLLDRLL